MSMKKVRLAVVVILLTVTNVIEAKVNTYADDSLENGSNNYLGYEVPSADEIAESWVKSQIYQNKEEKSDEINHDEDKPQVSRESFTVGKNWIIKKYCVMSKNDKNCMEIGMKEGKIGFPVTLRIRSEPITKNKTLVSIEMENKDKLSQKKMALTYKEQNIEKKNQSGFRKKKRSIYSENENDSNYELDENYYDIKEKQDEEEELKRNIDQNNEYSAEAGSDNNKKLIKRKLASGYRKRADPYSDSEPSKYGSSAISAGPSQSEKCRLPDTIKNAGLGCTFTDDEVICYLQCAAGYTFKEGGTRVTHCKFKEGKWSNKFEGCKRKQKQKDSGSDRADSPQEEEHFSSEAQEHDSPEVPEQDSKEYPQNDPISGGDSFSD